MAFPVVAPQKIRKCGTWGIVQSSWVFSQVDELSRGRGVAEVSELLDTWSLISHPKHDSEGMPSRNPIDPTLVCASLEATTSKCTPERVKTNR